jgi:hypothetical protein
MTRVRLHPLEILMGFLAVGITLALLCIPVGCAAMADVAELRTDLTGVKTEVTTIGTQMRDVTATVGDIGGGGDSITSWMYAAIAGAAILYPVVVRPIRKKFCKGEAKT